ncbi:MAG: xanthine dehydrogenase family protein molybdopterin-binding subunit [Deltaproteobacteria bacterium]|nr:xanthine dehydrogenase family protein molybdopterin-binding subunit [Deltaproteobacteria bacterium]
MTVDIDRRSFLKGSLAVGLTIAISITPGGFQLLNASDNKKQAPAGFKPSAWYEIGPDNTIRVWIPSSEMGQGALTTLPMIIADELEADWDQMRILQAPAADVFKNPVFQMQMTVGSASVRGWYEPLRTAGAVGRAMLVKAAAGTWNVPEEECQAAKGAVRHLKTQRSLTYGQLCLKAATFEVPKEAPLKKESEFRYMGKFMPRVDIPDKVKGTAIFGFDVSVSDMAYAALVRPPAYGAKPMAYDEAAAMNIKGVYKIVPTPNGLAVCAESIETAWKGRQALKVKWGPGSHPDLSTESLEKNFHGQLDQQGQVAISRGDAALALRDAAKKVEATYYVPCVAHATMEPMNCTAHIRPDGCDLWVPTQAQTLAQMTAAKLTGLPLEKVNVHTTLLGCGLGRRARLDFVIEAVLASKAMGRPVKVLWTREEDMQYDAFRAATCQRIQAGLDGQGRLTAWSHKVVCLSILKHMNPDALKNGIDYYSLLGLVDYPGSTGINNFIQYQISNFYVEQILSDLPVPAAPWRSVQNAPNAFIIECFLDELAQAAGRDPLEFRLQLLSNNQRSRRVLETVAEKSGWGRPLAKGWGRGIAHHACFGSYVAQVAEVSVNPGDGRIRVHRVVVAVDCGPVVNPDALIAQIEGAVVMGLSTTLKEEIQFANGGVKSANFDDYPLLKMSEVPEIEVHVIQSNDRIGGMGEPGITPVAPAVANAVFQATGARIRRLPLTPERVSAALQAK